jgi:hypothetical protein
MDGGSGSRMSDYDIEKALFDVEDLLGRVLVPFILLGETARSIKDGEILGGTAVDIGIRELELNKSALRTIKTFYFEGGFNKTERGYEYTSHGIPVRIHVLNKKWKFLENPEQVFYGPATYLVPNPFKDYWKARHLVR